MPPSLSAAAAASSSLLLSLTSSSSPSPYSLLPPSPHLLPLRSPISFWSAPPPHHISAMTCTSPTPSSSSSSSFPRLLYTGSTAGDLVQWEPLPSRSSPSPSQHLPPPTPHSQPSPSLSLFPSFSSSPSLHPSAPTFRPRFFSHRRGSSHLTCLTSVLHLSTPLIAAASSEGFLSLWHPSGECLASSFLLPFHATLLLPFYSIPTFSSSSSYLIACSSHHPYLYVVSLPSLTPVLILGHEKDSTGILAATFQLKRTRRPPADPSLSSSTPSTPHHSPPTPTRSQPPPPAIDERPMLVTISRSGVVNVWDVHSKLRKQVERRGVLPFFSFSTFQTAVLSASERESVEARGMVGVSEGLLLVLERRGVALVGGVTLTVMRRLSVEELTGGEWPAEDEFVSMLLAPTTAPSASSCRLLLTSLARVLLTVTLECRYEKGRRKDGKLEESCTVACTCDGVIRLDEHRRGVGEAAKGGAVLLPATTASCVDVVDEHIVVGHEGGEVSVYALPSQGAACSGPVFYTCLPFAFPALSLSSLSSPAVTSSHLSLTLAPPFLHHCVGYEDGSLHLTSLTSPSTSPPFSSLPIPAHSAPLRCMLDVHDRVLHKRMLVTAGDDGFVCVWDVERRKQAARVFVAAPVVGLVQLSLPSSSSPATGTAASSASSATSWMAFRALSSSSSPLFYLPSLLFVLLSTRAISVVSLLDYSLLSTLRGHVTPPLTLAYPPSSLYSDLLYVRCADDSVWVWALSSGHLVTTMKGEEGKERDAVEDLWKGVEAEAGEGRGGGGGDDGQTELGLACQKAREEVREKRQRAREARGMARRSSSGSAATPSAFASLAASPFLLSALSSLSSSAPCVLPSLCPIPFPPTLRERQTEFIQSLSTLFPSPALAQLERDREAAEDEEKEKAAAAQSDRAKGREEERLEGQMQRHREIQHARRTEEAKLQAEEEAAEARRCTETTGEIMAPPSFDVISFAARASSCSLSRCLALAVFDVPSLLEQLQMLWSAHADDGQSGDGHHPYLNELLSLFFDWDGKGGVESLLRDGLHLPPPRPSRGFTLLSLDDAALTVLFPSHGSSRRWQVGEAFTAGYALTVSSLCLALPPSPSVFKLLQHYQHTLPSTSRYTSPSLPLLLSYTLHPSPLISTSARRLTTDLLHRLGPEATPELSLAWSSYFDYPLTSMDILWRKDPDEQGAGGGEGGGGDRASSLDPSPSSLPPLEPDIPLVSDRELLVTLLMTYIGVAEMEWKRRRRRHHRLLLDPPPTLSSSSSSLTEFEAKSQYITHTLLRVIARPLPPHPPSSPYATHLYRSCALACDLLRAALPFLRIHIATPLPLLRHLLSLSLSPSTEVGVAASNLLLGCGRFAPSFFIECMGKAALNGLNSPLVRQSAISSFTLLLKRHPHALHRTLPAAVLSIVRTLDPSSPSLRKTCLLSTTSALYHLTSTYPSTSFHQPSQRFAVAAGSSVVVYDLRTATVWRVLEGGGGGGDVVGVLFSKDEEGGKLVSYEGGGGGVGGDGAGAGGGSGGGEGMVRVWNTEVGGWLGGLIGMSGKCVKVVKLERVDVEAAVRREREEAKPAEQAQAEEERREDRKKEDRRKRRAGKQLTHSPLTPYANDRDSPTLFFPPSPSSTSSGPPTPPNPRRLPPAPTLTLLATTSSSPPILPGTPTSAPLPPPPLSLLDGSDDEEVEGMGPSIGIATYHSLPGAAVKEGPVNVGGVGGVGAKGRRGVGWVKRLMAVRMSWVKERVVRIVREDGSVKDVVVA